MFVNTTVVRALIALRGVDVATLSNLSHVSPAQLQRWLTGSGEQADDSVPFDTQLEVLRILGIHGEAPRPDVVHHWHVRESFFGSARRTYWALAALLDAFGEAEVSFLCREADPAFTLKHEAHFALRFATFRAILHITGHPLRALRFRPDDFPALGWAPGAMGVLLEPSEFTALAPGHIAPAQLDRHLNAAREALQWERLSDIAREANVSPEQLLTWVAASKSPKLTAHTARPMPPAGEVSPAPAAPVSGEAEAASQMPRSAHAQSPGAHAPGSDATFPNWDAKAGVDLEGDRACAAQSQSEALQPKERPICEARSAAFEPAERLEPNPEPRRRRAYRPYRGRAANLATASGILR